MTRGTEQARWPASGSDAGGGLWLAVRSFPVEEAPEPPVYEIRIMSSWSGLAAETVAEGTDPGPPALAVDSAGQVFVAWGGRRPEWEHALACLLAIGSGCSQSHLRM